VTATDASFGESQERPRPTLKSDLAAVQRVLSRLGSHRLLHAGIASLTDQALVSFSNFITMVLLARAMSPHDFGSFVIVYTGLLFANSFQSSLVTRPHNVFAAPMRDKMHEVYTGGAAGMQLLMATVFAGIPLAGAVVAYLMGLHATWLLLGLSAAVFCWQLQEFVRQVQFTNGRIGEVLRLDVISYGGQAAIIAALWYLHLLDGPRALFVLAGTSLASALYGFSRIELASLWHTLRPAMRSNWRFGKWLLADSMGQWLAIFIYPVAVAAMVSATAAGAFRTVLNVVQPMYIVVNAYQSLITPRVSRAYATGGKRAMFRLLAPSATVVFVLLFAYTAVVGAFGRQILHALYGGSYDDYAGLVWYVGLGYLLYHLSQAAALALMVQGQTRSIFISRIVVVPFTLTVGMWITWHFGLYGAAFASTVLAGSAILGMQYAFLLRGDRRTASRPNPVHPLVLSEDAVSESW